MTGPLEHCLFCQDQIVAYNYLQNEEDSQGKYFRSPDLGRLFKLMGMHLTGKQIANLNALSPASQSQSANNEKWIDKQCDKLLCLCCFEMVDKLGRLYRELENVREEIRSVINLGLLPVKEKCGKGSRSKKWKGLTFVELFQLLVRESAQSPVELVAGKEIKVFAC